MPPEVNLFKQVDLKVVMLEEKLEQKKLPELLKSLPSKYLAKYLELVLKA